MIYRYPQEVHDFVKAHVTQMRDPELAEACNKALGTDFTPSRMKSFRANHGYKNGLGRWTSEEYWKYQTRYPQGTFEFIRDNSWGVSSQKMADMVNEKFGISVTSGMIKQFRARHGIRSGETGWFQKGNPPATKGKTIEEICHYDPEKLARVKENQFKKGDRPVNELPVGTIVIGTKGYKLRKKQMEGSLWERWEFLHRAVWEEHNGPVPEGMVVSFRDSDKLNCDISNLMLITKGENASLTGNGYRFQDPDLTDAGLALIRLRNAARERRKDKKEEMKHDKL